MSRPPWWLLLAATAAPVFLIGGWTVAAALQPASYDPIRDTISSLAGLGATDRWVMTIAIAGLGIAHVITALGLYVVASAGRIILAIGGLATLAVCALPLPPVGTSTSHGLTAMVGFLTLALWPLFSARLRGDERGGSVVWALRRPVAITASVVLSVLIIWFGVQLLDQQLVGLSERVAAGAESLWPLAVVISYFAGARAVQTASAVDTVPARSWSRPGRDWG